MNILIVGNGGREHALAWKVAQNPQVTQIWVAPGNPGTASEAKVTNVAIDSTDIAQLVQFAQEKAINLTLVGPEIPLVKGIVDAFQAVGLRCFGPNKACAQLEGSKAFTKDFLQRHRIPTAAYQSFDQQQLSQAIAYLKQQSLPIVIKADGLAAGKGVVIAQTEQEAVQTITEMLSGQAFGQAGQRIVIEEFLVGEEASFICMVDGSHILPLATSQDHKARNDTDTGPNTGGMGAYSPAPVITPALSQRIMYEIMEPTVRGMAKDGQLYTGFLYAGVMITKDGAPKVLEFNCRLGDPETQPIMMRLKSDLVVLCNAALDKNLQNVNAEWSTDVALGVVLTAGEYPAGSSKGVAIKGIAANSDLPADVKIFHAGTLQQQGQILTNGGRILCVTALAKTVRQAQDKAYALIKQISWPGMHYRRDIGYRAIARE